MQLWLLGESRRLIQLNALLQFLRSDAPTGLKIIVIGISITVLTTLPLLLYILVGPVDGNPIGLGLLFVAGVAIGILGFLLGIAWLIAEHFMNRRGSGQP